MLDKSPEQTPEILDAATVEAIEEGLRSEKQGDFMTMDQAVQFAKQRRETWQSIPEATA